MRSTRLDTYPILTVNIQDAKEIDMVAQASCEHHKKVMEMFSYYMEVMQEGNVEIIAMRS